ncbi:SymE family type I addiction module toxin [Dickeya dadantii]|nr:SymE family type I addiction module toxin [Dickeya dadantii]QWT40953.1 type I toxin-antitoxin system SymE family toxin [Dickeya dadantii]
MPGCMVITDQNTRELWHCLEDLGFNTGQPVIVTVERGRLVIEAELRI